MSQLTASSSNVDSKRRCDLGQRDVGRAPLEAGAVDMQIDAGFAVGELVDHWLAGDPGREGTGEAVFVNF